MTTTATATEKIWTNSWTHPATGQVRRYLPTETWTELASLEIRRYNTGNVSYASYKGEKIANARAAAALAAKVWIDENDLVHVDRWSGRLDGYVDLDAVRADIQAAWTASLA